MYQPISFNVIRQALEWHGFPVPMLRQLSYRDLGDRAVVAEYVAIWPEHIIPQKYFFPDPLAKIQGVEVFATDLQSCFCSDVEVVNEFWDEVSQCVTALLYVYVDKCTLAFQDILNTL